MTYYSYSFSIPASTAEDTPQELECKLTAGILTECEIVFPAGCSDLVRCAIFLGEEQIIPRRPSDWLRGHNDRVRIRPMLNIPRFHSKVTAKGWNDDDTYAHTLQLRFEILDPKLAFADQQLIASVTRMYQQLVDLTLTTAELAGGFKRFADLWQSGTEEAEAKEGGEKVVGGEE